MKRLTRTASVLSLCTLLACSTTPIQTTDQWGNPKFSMAIEDPIEGQRHRGVSGHISLVSSLSMLSGRFVGTGPDNQLTLDLDRLRDPQTSRASLLLTLSGRYRGVGVSRSGLLRLTGMGTTPRVTYYPDLESTASLRKASIRLDRAVKGPSCCVDLKPAGEGFSAETSCGAVFPGGTGAWSLEIQPGEILARNVHSSETLRFTKRKG